MASSDLKLNFAVSRRFGAFFTGGNVQVTSDGEHLLCCCGTKLQIVNIQTGQVEHSLEKDDDEISSFVLSPDDDILVVAGKSLILRQWNWKEEIITRSWKAIHMGVVSTMTFDCTSTLLATGGSDSTIKVWDIIQQYCTHNLRGHQGVVTAVEFHPDISRLQLFTAAEDYKIRVWNLKTSTCSAVLDAHFSVITSLQLSPTPGGDTLYSGGRDNVVSVFDLEQTKKVKTIPVYETVESLILLPRGKALPHLNVPQDDHTQFFMTAGSKGYLRIWNSQTAQCVYSQKSQENLDESSTTNMAPKSSAIVKTMYNKALDQVVVVTFDHNITFYNMEPLDLTKQFVGYNDEILDLKFFGENDSHIAVATNSEQIKMYETSTWNCQILHGHTNIVMGLDVNKKSNLLVSCSKDNTVRLWRMDAESQRVSCVAVGIGHTHAVASVAFSRLNPSFIVSGSEDLTIKMWPISNLLQRSNDDSAVITLHASLTEKAHDKDINSICVSPNDKLVATGSQDKTAKIWNAQSLALIGVMRGHKRGIWCVNFSPVDQCLATSSADGSIKLWALSDFSCVKTFEGHDCSVLKVCFITRGMQLITSGSDGLLKLWTVKSNECVKTFDEHEGKAWALALSNKEDIMVTGAEDSSILMWKDETEADQQKSRQEFEKLILQEQQLSNLLQQKKYLKAIGLAITLDQPFRVLNIFKDILTSKGNEDLENTVKKLRVDQIDSVLKFAVRWNTNSKHCHVAQFVVNVVLKSFSPEELMKFPNIKSIVEGLLPYTERHFSRMNRLLQQSTFVDYTWHCMRLVAEDSDQPYTTTQSEENITEKTDPTTQSCELDQTKCERENSCEHEETDSKPSNNYPSDKENEVSSKQESLKDEPTKKKKVPTATLR